MERGPGGIPEPEMGKDDLLYTTGNKVATITLNRPDKLNAMTVGMHYALLDLLDRADKDDSVRAVVVTGSGRAFCAGADLASDNKFGQGEDGAETYRDCSGEVSLRILSMTKPCIAAINGAAVGVGITMTLPMDIRIGAKGAKTGFVFTRRGIVNEACSSYFLPRLVGMPKALEWLITGRVFTAEEGLAAGLFNVVTEQENVLAAAYAYAAEIAENTAPVSVALARRLLWEGQWAGHPLISHHLESRCLHYLGSSRDAEEGIASFLEKRAPEWTMTTTADMPPFSLSAQDHTTKRNES